MEEWQIQFTEILKKYRHTCKIIKQINSDKADRQSIIHLILTSGTILASVLITAIGFMDKRNIIEFVNPEIRLSNGAYALYAPTPHDMLFFEVMYNLVVLFILAFSITMLIFRPLEKAFEHNRSVIVLSSFMRDLDNYINYNRNTEDEIKLLLPEISSRYNTILCFMPKHSDRNFRKAKLHLLKKEQHDTSTQTNK